MLVCVLPSLVVIYCGSKRCYLLPVTAVIRRISWGRLHPLPPPPQKERGRSLAPPTRESRQVSLWWCFSEFFENRMILFYIIVYCKTNPLDHFLFFMSILKQLK